MTDLERLKRFQSRRFMVRFDLPNQDIGVYTEADLHGMFEKACCPTDREGNARWKVWGQLEQGKKTGRYHFQLYYESLTESPIRASTIVRAIRRQTDTDEKRVSVDIQRAVKTPGRCVGYVTKDDKTRIFGPWSNVPAEEWPQVDDADSGTKREDLYQAFMIDGMNLREVLKNPGLSVAASTCIRWAQKMDRERQAALFGTDGNRRDMNVVYLHGPSNTGKTTSAGEYLHSAVGPYFTVSDFRRDPWDGYEGERGVLLDDLRLPTPQFDLSDMLKLLDGAPYMLSRRYENCWACFDHVVITSNWSLRAQWDSLAASAPKSSPLTDSDRQAFYRRFTRVLSVGVDGRLTDETADYRGDVDSHGRMSAADLSRSLAA